MTALHLAARFSSGLVVRTLIEAGADVNAQDSYQQSPLHVADADVDADVDTGADTDADAGAGADVNAQDSYQQSPLHIAALYKPPLSLSLSLSLSFSSRC